MEVVLDSNVLFRILISQGQIIHLIFNDKLRIFAPLKLKEEFLKNQNEILSKSSLSREEFNELCAFIFDKITFIPLSEYKEFIPKAKEILRDHEKDEDFIALCLMKNIKLWTYESLIFSLGFAISTKEISDKLQN
jgi:predicted nucleic acid-binding protein